MADFYLEDLRKEAGLSMVQVISAMREIAPEVAPKNRQGVMHWESQGIFDFRIVDGLSHIYGKPADIVKAAALASKDRFRRRCKMTLK